MTTAKQDAAVGLGVEGAGAVVVGQTHSVVVGAADIVVVGAAVVGAVVVGAAVVGAAVVGAAVVGAAVVGAAVVGVAVVGAVVLSGHVAFRKPLNSPAGKRAVCTTAYSSSLTNASKIVEVKLNV